MCWLGLGRVHNHCLFDWINWVCTKILNKKRRLSQRYNDLVQHWLYGCGKPNQKQIEPALSSATLVEKTLNSKLED